MFNIPFAHRFNLEHCRNLPNGLVARTGGSCGDTPGVGPSIVSSVPAMLSDLGQACGPL